MLYVHLVIVVQAQSNNIPILAQRNENKSMPTFVFFLNEEVINIVKGCNSP